ncbi:helix-turn-helix transcriptional regulator [Bradyrhizobium tunisiense]|uniref:helix-turn-helix transcriptional regulator n=1 Tax=Bradyrhizobium tunisiense TaxID=3278709 RepID=UPI0035DC7411
MPQHIARTEKQLGAILRRARKRAGLTQSELGKNIHLRQGTVSRLEAGAPAPHPHGSAGCPRGTPLRPSSARLASNIEGRAPPNPERLNIRAQLNTDNFECAAAPQFWFSEVQHLFGADERIAAIDDVVRACSAASYDPLDAGLSAEVERQGLGMNRCVNRSERRLSLFDSPTACRRRSCSVGDVSCEKQQAVISEEEVQLVAAVVDAVVPAAVLGHERGAVD